MRGRDTKQSSMLCLMSPEDRVPAKHPLRAIKALTDEVLKDLSPVFDQMYSRIGRPSVPPERLLKATVLIALYSVRSDRMFCEELDYNLLYRWFLDMDMVEPGFHPTSFTKNRERLLEHDIAAEFLARVVARGRAKGLMSADHFSVDGTLIEAWASHKSFRPKDEDDDGDNNGWSNFKGKKRSNETHESKTDPEAKLMRKGAGQPAKLSYSAHAMMENRNGLIVDFEVCEANGRAEREAAEAMLERIPGDHEITLAADKGYDTKAFVAACLSFWTKPHISQNKGPRRSSAVPDEVAATKGYEISTVVRRRIEQIFGWMKTVGGFRRTRFKGRRRTKALGQFVAASYNLLRIAKLTQPA